MTTVTEVGRTRANELQDPTPVRQFRLTGADGVDVRLLDLGAMVRLVRLPDRAGGFADVTLSLDTVADYEDHERNPHLGVTVGRYANRIAGSRLSVDGHEHPLVANEGPNQLHGGPLGFGRLVWTGTPVDRGVRFRRTSPAGEMGFPGTLEVSTHYEVEPGRIAVTMEATTDAPTVVSLTNHTYWNLGGPAEADVLDHEVTIPAAAVLPVDDANLPTGPPEPVDHTPFDLRSPARLGDRIGLALPAGYDHCFVPDGVGLRLHGRVEHPGTGRWLEVWSDAPGVQFYTGAGLPGGAGGRGRRHGPYAGLCLEPQHLPDAPNRPWAPSPVLRPGERYQHRLEFRYGAE